MDFIIAALVKRSPRTMQQSYNCKLYELEASRLEALKCKKEAFDEISKRRMRLRESEIGFQSTLKREIADLLDRKEIISFLLKAEPFLRKLQVLQQQPQASSFEMRQELHQQFIEEFGMHDTVPLALQMRRKKEYQARQRSRDLLEDQTCAGCGSTGIEFVKSADSNLVCPKCGTLRCDVIQDGIDGLPYEDQTRIGSPPYTYKPEQHFTDLLNQVQGNTRRPIPSEIFMQLRLECRKRGIAQESITPQMIRRILREIHRTEFYDEICAIAHTLNPAYELVKIKEEDQALLRALFREVYSHFHEAKARVNPTRKNFMSYPHLARVLCDLMGFTSYTKEFTSLKNREKRRNHDQLLKEIFTMLGWPFRNTV